MDDAAGPFLRHQSYDPVTELYSVSCLVVSDSTIHKARPTLDYTFQGKTTTVKGDLLETVDSWQFWRFDISVTCRDAEALVEYKLSFKRWPIGFWRGPTQTWSFCVPGKDQDWHWGFYSCNGFHWEDRPEYEEYGGIAPLWSDVLKRHSDRPLHVMVGGGDQLYNDLVWDEEVNKAWLERGWDEKCSAPITEEQELATCQYYFNHYKRHWSSEYFRDALASIPQMMMWDDHDIFDGWGSYPDKLQNSPVFQGVYSAARRFYLLFQHHTTVERAREQNGLFGKDGYCFMNYLGKKVALVGLDLRSERTKRVVMEPETWAMVKQRMEGIQDSVQHVVVLSTVPVLYPVVPLSEGTLTRISGMAKSEVLTKMMQMTGLFAKVMNEFDTPDLLDDLLDHWTADTHKLERKQFVATLQTLSYSKKLRVTFLCGDVHCCGIGRFYSYPKLRSFVRDHRYMPQVISSAIGNHPPPNALMTLLGFSSRSKMVNHHTRTKMVKKFPGKKKLWPHRNWAEVFLRCEKEDVEDEKKKGLVFQLRCEHPDTKGKVEGAKDPMTFEEFVPRYDPTKRKLVDKAKGRFPWLKGIFSSRTPSDEPSLPHTDTMNMAM
ncbi:unnamed protein product [Ostreobium quekettii]|uniref:PhoD-like phosphatase domain-containing protein n=1 Tax=Ostreobium quekettii TaxID=121088 RepID=A0A8S1J702_9CHLO|nr:unnamed protein product [Ostreobium quekettii]|eukprot:evm.model.scf_973.5 EVM.evm.TU.scf_973.5   scf_973:25508-29235(+)